MADKSTGSQASSKPQNFSREEADRQPWRYRGYAAFTEWSASDDDFLVLRKFNAISIRVMLYLQDQIVVLEDDLRDVDQECRRASDELADGGTFRFDQWERRGQILTDLALHIKRYRRTSPQRRILTPCLLRIERFVSDHLELKARPKASAHQIDNVKQWLKNAKKPITESEVAYLEQSEDLITMALKRKSPIRHVFDKFDIWRKIPGIRNTKVRSTQMTGQNKTTDHNRQTKSALIKQMSRARRLSAITIALLIF
ncbi:hypothetical protein ACLMJK_001412 [Lecanora helva]